MKEIAPSGYISLDLLVEMFEPPSFLPEIWQNVTIQQLEEIFSIHLCETKYINWRTVLLSCVLPLPLPTQHELISAANQYGSMDKEGRGVLDVSEYARVRSIFPTNIPIGHTKLNSLIVVSLPLIVRLTS